MSSDNSFTATLALVKRNVYRFGGPILMVIGTVGCILSVLVFTKKTLRKNPCSIYLVAFNASNFLLILTSILYSVLVIGYNINLSSYSSSQCHFRYYTLFLFDILSSSYLILASIDRLLLTSPNARTRQRSNPSFAYRCIIIVTMFWLLLHTHALILPNLVQLSPGVFLCTVQPGLYLTLLTYYSLIIKDIVCPLLMVIFGLWTVRNIRKVRHVVPLSVALPSANVVNRHMRAEHTKNRQLLRILLTDIAVCVMFNSLLAITLLYQQFDPNQVAGSVKAQIVSLLSSVGVFCTYIPFCIGCYTNLLASKTFRREIKNIFLCK